MKNGPAFPMPPVTMQNGALVSSAVRAGDGVRSYLRHVLGFPSHTAAALPDGAILVNGAVPPPKYRLAAGDVLTIDLREDPNPHILPVPHPLNVLWEDEHVLLLDKPAGVPTHPSHGHREDTLANFVAAYAIFRGERFPFRPVNRLDKDTSGVVLVAKHRLAAARLAASLAAGEIRKTYFAVTRGAPDEDAGDVCLPIARKPGSVIEREIREDGEYALSRFRVLFRGEDAALLLSPVTGRTHQLRVHMAALGHPIVGDAMYGAPDPRVARQALHAVCLSFPHPVTGISVTVRAPLPRDVLALLPPETIPSLFAKTGGSSSADRRAPGDILWR